MPSSTVALSTNSEHFNMSWYEKMGIDLSYYRKSADHYEKK
jgi:hypothetical protein